MGNITYKQYPDYKSHNGKEVTVRDVLAIPGLPHMTLISGKDGLNNLVENVSVYEVEDAYKWFRGKEVIITTFRSVTQSEYKKVMRELATKKIAAIILCYPELYYGIVPSELIRLSNYYKIPMLTVSSDVAYVDIIVPIMKFLFERKGLDTNIHEFKMVDDPSHFLFSGTILNDYVSIIYKHIGRPVLLLDEHNIPIAYSYEEDEELVNLSVFVKNQLPLLERNYTPQQFKQALFLQDDNCGETTGIFPITSGGSYLGALVLLGITKDFSELLETIERYYIETLAILMCSCHKNNNLRSDIAQLIQQEGRTAEHAQQIFRKLVLLGIDPTEPIRLVIVIIDAIDSKANSRTRGLEAKNYFHIRTGVELYYPRAVVVELSSNKYMIIIPWTSDRKCMSCIYNVFNELKNRLSKLQLSLSISPLITKPEQLLTSYELCVDALNIDRFISFQSSGKIVWAEQLEPLIYLKQLINDNNKDNSLIKWAYKFLEPIIKYDAEKKGHLFETLKMILFTNTSLRKIAERLFIHKNTLMYRKQLIERILNTSIEEKKFLLSLAVAIISLCGDPN